ncbi:MAG: type II toxin-antitoxin system RelE/ParE family toxin [Roseateles sp.]|uniref:type II toxin-antitoxin system RelE/ParE family toxin n=1 Tax=Roseateles sp. TaxID=1971397 RepID=UPI0039EA7632
MARVTRRPQAEADVLEIWAFIAEDSVAEADRWVDRLDEKLALWATQPLMGKDRKELWPGIHSFAFGRYVVFYTPLQDGIDLVRVIHSAMDTENRFVL